MKKSVFNLDTAIATWRSLLGRRRVFIGDDLEELEGHLRDHISQLVHQGHSEEEAFQQARAHLGDFTLLEKAYKHVFWRKLKHNKQLLGNLFYHISMIKSYLKLAVRNLKKHKGYSAINISGLAVGLACSFFIFIWIQHQLSIDNFHAKGDRLFQVKIDDHGGDGLARWSNVPMPLASTLASSFPEVEHAVLTLPIRAALKQSGHSSREQGYYAGAGFFDTFSFPFIAGDPAQALNDPSSIVISESVAAKYFGPNWQAGQTILGKTLTLDYWQSDGGVLGQAVTVNSGKDFMISGVFKEVPRYSSLQFDIVLPVAEVVQNFAHIQGWGPRWFELTLTLQTGVDAKVFGNKAASVLRDNVEGAENQDLVLQSFGHVYLHSTNENGTQSAGRIQQVYIIGLIGLAILLIACVNFMNLVTARSGQRAREIGVRKALGATPSSLIQQFLGEAILTSVLALFFAVGLLIAGLPLFNSVAGTAITVSDLALQNWFYFGLIALVTGVMAGSYPSFYLASQRVVSVFRSQIKTGQKGEVSLRKGLVVFQFGVSAFLIVGTLTVYQQLNYLQNKNLGLDKENVAMIRLEGAMHQQFD
ncbi:MAG: ABC transporter permease, partial [Rhodothermales bacterium]